MARGLAAAGVVAGTSTAVVPAALRLCHLLAAPSHFFHEPSIVELFLNRRARHKMSMFEFSVTCAKVPCSGCFSLPTSRNSSARRVSVDVGNPRWGGHELVERVLLAADVREEEPDHAHVLLRLRHGAQQALFGLPAPPPPSVCCPP